MSKDSYTRVKVAKDKYESLLDANAELVKKLRNIAGQLMVNTNIAVEEIIDIEEFADKYDQHVKESDDDNT